MVLSDAGAVLRALSDSERSLAGGNAVLVSFVSHRHAGINLGHPLNLVQISSGSIGASLSNESLRVRRGTPVPQSRPGPTGSERRGAAGCHVIRPIGGPSAGKAKIGET